MEEVAPHIKTDVVVLGAGISGLVTAKCMADKGFSVIVLESTTEVGGLWTFRENDYGVMRFTHINVSKYNYCFSDFPFADEVPDYPHHVDMARYIVSYVEHFNLQDNIRFLRKVVTVEKEDIALYIVSYVEHFSLQDKIMFLRNVVTVEKDSEHWKVVAKQLEDDGHTERPLVEDEVYDAKYVAIATGHHSKPRFATFRGQDTFKGEIIHSVKFNDAISNGMVGKRVLVVGIGNSAVDVAVNCAEVGRCKSVYISTRSGAWVVPNYLFGHPIDCYSSRLFFMLPWKLAQFIFESIIKLVSGNPKKWKLRPKMGALQTQPTVSPTLIHHIQRQNVKVVPNIQRIEGSTVHFIDGESAEFDHIILCTGYKIHLPFLTDTLKKEVLDSDTNQIKLYKNVFSPTEPSLAFIGFVQPASGGVITMSELQARWFAELSRGAVTLPNKYQMAYLIKKEHAADKDRYYESARHTIQRDPIVYNDEIASYIGAKPTLTKNPSLAWRLMFSSCGAYQWRLQGPDRWVGARDAVMKTPLTEFMHYTGVVLVVLFSVLLFYFCRLVGVF